MVNRLKETFINYKVIIQNFSYLSILQIFSILLPLVTYPYLIRVLGAETYGVIIFAQAIVMYFSIVINFGFNISATKDVAENKRDNIKLNEIVSSVFSIKIILWIISLAVFIGLIIIIPSFKKEWLLFVLAFGMTFNELLFPQWFFQGIEKMRYITIINILSKILFTVLIFIFIHTKEDYLLVPLFQGLGAFLGGILAIYVLVKKENIVLSFQNKSVLSYYFFESLPLFISSASIQIYVNANRVLIGVFLGMKEVAYYDLGEKVLRLIKIPVGMLGQAAFPSLAREKSIVKINKIMKFGVLLTICLMLLVFVFSNFIVDVLGGENMQAAVPIMRILSLSALMVALSQFLGTSRLIVFGYKKIFTQIIASSGFVFCIGAFTLYKTENISLYSLAWLAVIVEGWVTLLMFIACYKNKLLKE